MWLRGRVFPLTLTLSLRERELSECGVPSGGGFLPLPRERELTECGVMSGGGFLPLPRERAGMRGNCRYGAAFSRGRGNCPSAG